MPQRDRPYQSVAALFDELDRTRGSLTQETFDRLVGESNWMYGSAREFRRFVNFFGAVNIRRLRGETLDPRSAQLLRGLAEDVRLGAEAAWVEDVLPKYLLWTLEKERAQAADHERVERVIGEMWLPLFEEFPPFLISGDGQVHTRPIGGRAFRWKESTDEKPVRAAVEWCWLTESDHRWLSDAYLPDRERGMAERLQAQYTRLQQEAAEYVTRAARERTTHEVVDPAERASLLSQNQVDEARRIHYTGQSPLAFPRYEDAVYFAITPVQLNDRIGTFSDEVRATRPAGWTRRG